MPSNKKIVYVTSARLPTEKAHGLATVKIAEALSEAGYQVDLVIPKLWRKSNEDIFGHYSLKRNFNIVRIPCIDLLPLRFFDKPFFIIQSLSFSLAFLVYELFKSFKEKENIIFFSHDYIPLYFSSFLPGRVFYDIHHFPGNNFMYRTLMKRSFAFSVQTKWKIAELKKRFDIPQERIVYWPNGTDISKFDIDVSKEEARRELGLPQDKKLAVYTGSIQPWKGVDTLEKAKDFLPQDIEVVIVSDRPHGEIPLYLKAADVLVLPNTGKQKVSLYYTSPMKLFEYMASGRPVVATSIPSVLEVVDESTAILVKADDPESMAEGIKRAVVDESLAQRIAQNALREVQKYIWISRAKKIINLMEKNA